MTYAISSALKRYESGTATRLSLRAAWIVASTSSEFGPHHTSRSPGCAPAARRPCASRFTSALSSAKVVVDGRAPPDASTITAVRSPSSARAARSRRAERSCPRSFPLPVPERSRRVDRERGPARADVRGLTYARPMGRAFAVRGIVEGFYGTPWSHERGSTRSRSSRRAGSNAYVYAPKDDAKHRAEWRVPYDAGERGALRRARRARRGARRALRLRDLARPRHRLRVRRRPRRAARQARSRCSTPACRGSCCCSTTSRCSPASRPARPSSRRGCSSGSAPRAPTRRSRSARPSTSAPGRRRTSASSARACPPRST